jgi:hypothetical protein
MDLSTKIHRSRSIIRIIKSRRMRLAGHVARIGEKRNVYRILVGKPEGMDLREIGWDGMDSIDMAQDKDNGRIF